MIHLRIAEGDPTEPVTLLEGEWPGIPRGGEKIYFEDKNGRPVLREVREIHYLPRSTGDLMSVTCMV